MLSSSSEAAFFFFRSLHWWTTEWIRQTPFALSMSETCEMSSNCKGNCSFDPSLERCFWFVLAFGWLETFLLDTNSSTAHLCSKETVPLFACIGKLALCASTANGNIQLSVSSIATSPLPKPKQQADGKPTTHSLSLRLPFRWLCSFFCFLRSLKGDDHQMEMPNRLHWFPVQKHVCEIEGKEVLTLMTLDVNQKLIRIRSFVSLQCTHKFWFLQCTHKCQMQFVCWHCKTNN